MEYVNKILIIENFSDLIHILNMKSMLIYYLNVMEWIKRKCNFNLRWGAKYPNIVLLNWDNEWVVRNCINIPK